MGQLATLYIIIPCYNEEDEHILGICQSRNRGHQNAVLAGLMEAKEKKE